MSFKHKFKNILFFQQLKRITCFIWDFFVVHAAVGGLFLTLTLVATGGLVKGTETILSFTAEAATVGVAPSGMFNLSVCLDDDSYRINMFHPGAECQQSVIETVSIEELAKEITSSLLYIILGFYYLWSLLFSYLLSVLYMISAFLVQKLRHLFNQKKSDQVTQEAAQFEEDVNWCIGEINQHFSDQPYWEESVITDFTRGNNIDEQYWKTVNQVATKRSTEFPVTLLHIEAYRELNRMALFAINVMAGTLLDCRYNTNINKQALEKILRITHDQLSVRAPSSLPEHDSLLQEVQTCIDHFCEAIGEPSDDFIDFAGKMNTLRLKDKQF